MESDSPASGPTPRIWLRKVGALYTEQAVPGIQSKPFVPAEYYDDQREELERYRNASVYKLLAPRSEVDHLRKELRHALGFIEMQGYRRCDIPACNCPYWHGGNADERLRELSDELGDLTQGTTILGAVQALREKLQQAEAARHAAEKELLEVEQRIAAGEARVGELENIASTAVRDNERLVDQLDEARRDTQRIDWLESHPCFSYESKQGQCIELNTPDDRVSDADSLREAIDAAMSASEAGE